MGHDSKRIKQSIANFYAREEKRSAPPKPRKPSTSTIPSEGQEQARLARLLDRLGLVWCHVVNESLGKFSHQQNSRLKARGRKAGVPDNLIFTPSPKIGRPCAIELKRIQGGKLSAVQSSWLEMLDSCGWSVFCCEGYDAAVKALTECGYITDDNLRDWGL